MSNVGEASTARKISFDERYQQYERYMHKVAMTYAGNHPFSSEEDLFQELSIALWKCVEKDHEGAVEDFHQHFCTSVANQIASHYRLKMIEQDKKMVRLDAVRRGAHLQHGISDSDTGAAIFKATRNDESEDFYRAGIFEIIESVDPETAKVVMEALDKNNRGPMAGRVRAFDRVRKKLQDV